MNHVFKPFLRRFVLVFFNDILICSPDWDSHLQHVQLVLNTLQAHSLRAKLSKCDFGVQKSEYLGHIISQEGVASDPCKIKAIQDWPTPRTIKHLRVFLGLTGYYRRFIRDYGKLGKPMTQLSKKDSFCWNVVAQQAFDHLKQVMVQPPILAPPDFSEPFTIEADASE